MKTRFRAYKLGSAGSLFSYFVEYGFEKHFTLIEARIPHSNQLALELRECGVTTIDTLHITSWDQDHCSYNDLSTILDKYRPKVIEIPAYEPDSNSSSNSYKCSIKIELYKKSTNAIVKKLSSPSNTGKNILYSPFAFLNYRQSDNGNNLSTVQMFNTGAFSVLSLGDVEDVSISDALCKYSSIKNVDVLILAHHGADNGFTTDAFIKYMNPRCAICSADYDNQYEHPKQNIRSILSNNNIPLYTTKTGDVIIEWQDSTKKCKVRNFIQDNEEIKDNHTFVPKISK